MNVAVVISYTNQVDDWAGTDSWGVTLHPPVTRENLHNALARLTAIAVADQFGADRIDFTEFTDTLNNLNRGAERVVYLPGDTPT